MISFEEAIKQQENLIELCRDRENPGNEIFPPNSYYGMSTILKQYAKINNKYQIKCVIPHGIVFNEESIWTYEISSSLPIILSYPQYRLKTYKKNSKKIIINFASPFVYLDKILRPICKSFHREGLIFFPAHSTHHISPILNHDLLAEKLINLDKRFQPVTVCIYWKDYLENHHIAYKKRGLKIVSAGHMFDSNFLYRLYYLLSIHKYSSSNIIGSSIFYSIKAGCVFHFLSTENVDYRGGSNDIIRDHPKENILIKTKINNIFPNQVDEITQEQSSTTDYFLNTKYLLSPLQVKLLFLLSEPLFFLRKVKQKFI